MVASSFLFGLWSQNYPIQTNKQRATLSNKINFHSSLCRLVGMGVSGRSKHTGKEEF
jgi:hypothetical protein